MRNWNAQFEWKVQDFWVGVFWKRTDITLDVWVCLLPCVPLHIRVWNEVCPRCRAVVNKLGTASDGQKFCCIHCAFHPGGCRCRLGEFGVAETEPACLLDEEDEDPTTIES